MNNKLTLGIAVIAIVIAIIGLFTPAGQSVVTALGGTTNYDALETTSLSVGSGCGDSYASCTGSAVTQILKGTCSLVSNTSIAATSTGTGTCAISGLVAGDKVFVSLATTTTKMAAQWAIIGTVAGTDSATVRLLNLTGTAAVPSATNGLGSSTQYWVVR